MPDEETKPGETDTIAPAPTEPASEADKKATSRKLIYVGIALAAVLAITLGGAALGLTEDDRAKAIDAVKWLITLLVTGHVLTDISVIVKGGGK